MSRRPIRSPRSHRRRPTSARRHFRSLTGRKTRSLIECLQPQLELWSLGGKVWEGGGGGMMETDETKRDRRRATASFQREQKQNKVSAVIRGCVSNRFDKRSALLKSPSVLVQLVGALSICNPPPKAHFLYPLTQPPPTPTHFKSKPTTIRGSKPLTMTKIPSFSRERL